MNSDEMRQAKWRLEGQRARKTSQAPDTASDIHSFSAIRSVWRCGCGGVYDYSHGCVYTCRDCGRTQQKVPK